MLGKVFVAILAVMLLLGAFATSISNGIKTLRTNDTTQGFTVAAGGATANVTLSYDLYQAAVAEVISITSNETADVPVGSSYAEATKYLLISGLDASKTHALSVRYYAETSSEIWRVLGPFLALLIFGGILASLAFGVFHKGGRRG